MKQCRAFVLGMLLVGLCLSGAAGVRAEGPPISLWYDTAQVSGEYTDLTLSRDFAAGTGHVANGDFHAWGKYGPTDWTLYTAERGGHDVRWAKVRWGGPPESPDYALSLLVRDSHRYYGGAYGAVCTELDVPREGDYWVTLHTTAWGSETIPYNSVAWYAITKYYRPWYVPDSAWRELYADPLSCRNAAGQCEFTARRELVHIVPGDTLCLQAGMKFREYNAWTLWVWDDISVTAAGNGAPGFVDEGSVQWTPAAAR